MNFLCFTTAFGAKKIFLRNSILYNFVFMFVFLFIFEGLLVFWYNFLCLPRTISVYEMWSRGWNQQKQKKTNKQISSPHLKSNSCVVVALRLCGRWRKKTFETVYLLCGSTYYLFKILFALIFEGWSCPNQIISRKKSVFLSSYIGYCIIEKPH